MKKTILLGAALFVIIILRAQGIYQLWGTTISGGTVNSGVIFHTDASGNNFRLNHEFDLNSNGIGPSGALIQNNGKFYGITRGGGSNNTGVIFEWDPATNVYTKKIDFSATNGSNPCVKMSLFNGKLYGMTSSGGSSDLGVIYEWDPVTNMYSKKIDFNTTDGNRPGGLAGLTLKGQKFYGMTEGGGSIDNGVIFEWDPVTNVYTKKVDLNNDPNGLLPAASLTLYGSRFYGLTIAGGVFGGGVIFEWDPVTNIYIKKHDFPPNEQFGSGPPTDLTLSGDKFYGITVNGGINNFGVIFEWDPVTNVYDAKINLDSTNGSYPQLSLTLSGSRFYGMTGLGGSNNLGVIFEWDPVSNLYLKKKDFDGTDGARPFGSALTLAQTPVANRLAGSCISFPAVTIDNSNNNIWVPIVDNEGNAVAEIKANGNNLGMVNASMYINGRAVREDGNKRLYLDRNITLTPQVQPTLPVDIRLYVKGSELLDLKNALNSNGDSSGVKTINDVAIYKIATDCSAGVSSALTDPLPARAEGWQDDYVFTASISSFSSFYFAGKCGSEPPLITNVSASPASLWPPNHQMENVDVNYNTSDNCGSVTNSLSVRSNEPVNGTGNGDMAPDWTILDDHHVQLRAERSGSANERVYTITITSKDASGNTSVKTTNVVVPHNMNGHAISSNIDANGIYYEDHLDYKITPNPSSQYFDIQIESVSNEKIEVNLFDIGGRLISKPGLVKNNTLRFGDNLKPGVYMVEVRQGQQKKVIEVIKE